MMLGVADGSSFQLVIFGVVIVGVVVAIIAVATNSGIYAQIGKGGLFEDAPPRGGGGAGASSAAERDAEIRQMLQARNERRLRRGEAPLDIDEELRRLSSPTGPDPALLAEIRELVVARNERRARRGEAPLDVEQEVARQVRELGA